MIEKLLPQQFKPVKLKIPYDSQNVVNYFMENYDVEYLEYIEDGTIMNLKINEIDLQKYKEYVILS